MRKLLGTLGAVTATVALMLAAADLSSAGGAPTMQATPATSEEPADVTVTNTDDAASTCEDPYSAKGIGAGPAAVGGQTVMLNLADDNGPVQTDTVTPDGMGNWAHTYTGLPAGNYQATGSCNAPTNGMTQAGPQAVPNPTFTYQPVNFVVTAPAEPEPEPEGDTADAGVTVGPVRAGPAFTG